jgi:hypothetical protein
MSPIVKASVLLFPLILLRCQIQVIDIESQDDHFSQVHKFTHDLRGFYDSESEPGTSNVMIKLFDDLSRSEFLMEHNFNLALVNINKVPSLKSHYDILKPSHFLYFIKNQMQIMPNFDDLVSAAINDPEHYDRLHKNVLEFVTAKFSRVTQEITSEDQFEKILQKDKIIGVFIGNDGQEFDTFKEFAQTHIDFDFYYILQPIIANEIFYKRSRIEKPVMSFFAIFRSAELITEFDPSIVVFTEKIKTLAELEAFFRSERYPKMIEGQDSSSLGYRIFSLGEKLVLYIHNEEDRTEINIFKETVKVLPKKFIFSQISTESSFFGSYMQYFMFGKTAVAPNKLYIIHLSYNSEIEIIPFNDTLTREGMIKFVFTFYRNNTPGFVLEAQRQQSEHDNHENPLNTDFGFSEEL